MDYILRGFVWKGAFSSRCIKLAAYKLQSLLFVAVRVKIKPNMNVFIVNGQ